MTGFILAGVGHRNSEGQNFLVVKSGCFWYKNNLHTHFSILFWFFEKDTEVKVVEDFFKLLTQRNDVGIILINQHVFF